MLNSLKDIFSKLTPTNINDIPLIKVAQSIFIDAIERNSKVAKRITNIFDVQERDEDSDLINNAKKNLKEGLYQTYLVILFKYLKSLVSDERLRDDLKKFGYTNAALYQDIYKIINTEFLQANKIYTEKVGNNSATKYMYAFSKYLESGTLTDDLTIAPESPFVIHKEGSLGRRMYREFTQPLEHQIGFVDNYETVFKLNLFDYFGVEIEEGFNRIEVICQDSGYIFIKDSTTETTIQYLETKINPITGKVFTRDEILQNFSIFPNKNILTWRKYRNEDDQLIIVFVFTDQTVLYHNYSTPKHTYFTTYEDYLNGFKNPTLSLGECYELSFDKANNFRFLYTDSLDSIQKDHYVTMIKEENKGGVGLSCYSELDETNAFRVTGKSREYTLGVSDSGFVTNYDDIKYYRNKFIPSLTTRIPNEGTIKISDSIDNNVVIDYYTGIERYRVNTFSLTGNVYKIALNDYIFPEFTVEATGLNNTKRPFKITDYYSTFGKISFSGNVNGTDTDKVLTLTDFKDKANTDYFIKIVYKSKNSNISKYLDYSEDLKFKFKFEFNTYGTDSDCEFHLMLIKYGTKPVIDEYVKISDVLRYTDFKPNVSVLHFDDIEFVQYNLQSISKPSELPYFDDFPPDAPGRIGERADGSFYGEIINLRDYPKEEWDNFANLLESGFPEGVLIYPDSKTADFRNYEGDHIFVNIGFKTVCVDTSDMNVITSPYFANDGDFDLDGDSDSFDGGIEVESTVDGYYLFSDYEPEKDGNCYLFSRDSNYLYARKNDIKFSTHTITAELDGGVGTTSYTFKGKKTFEFVRNKLGIPYKEGNVFIGWSIQPGTYNYTDDNKVIESDMTLYAIYDELRD